MKFLMILFALKIITANAAAYDCNLPKIAKPSAPAGSPVMWVDRGPIQNLNLLVGGTSASRAPSDVLYFDKNKTKGTSPGLKALDSNCVKWGLKFNGSKGREIHAEVAATRLAWAMGLNVEDTYYRNNLQIVFSKNAPAPGKPDRRYEALSDDAKKFVAKNGRVGVPIRLEREEPGDIEYEQTWFYNSNPIKNNPATAKHFSAQVIFNVLIGNWDLGKSAEKSQNKIIGKPLANGNIADWYVVSDYGGSFGEIGKRKMMSRNHSKYELKDFDLKTNGGKNDPPVNYVRNGVMHMNFDGEIISGHVSTHRQIPLEHARWFADVIAQLSQDQIRDAFRAAGASKTEVEGFSRILKARIDQFVECARHPLRCATPTGS